MNSNLVKSVLSATNVLRGFIFLDLNDTLIDSETYTINVGVDSFVSTVKMAKVKGYSVCMCSDSPHEPLVNWGMKFGIDGPAISENGMLFDGKLIFQIEGNTTLIRHEIIKYLERIGVMILPDILAKEFNGTVPKNTGVAFGNGRICSLSVFCFKNGNADQEISQKINEFVQKNFPGASIDLNEELGIIMIHFGDLKTKKRRLLKIIGEILAQHSKSCWMIGNSMSDVTQSNLCKVGVVANASAEAKSFADLVATESYTKGVIELVKTIVLNH